MLPNGDVLDMMSVMRKDNTGYHLPQMFVGSEGTLGVITKAAIQCYPKPAVTATAFAGLCFQHVLLVRHIVYVHSSWWFYLAHMCGRESRLLKFVLIFDLEGCTYNSCSGVTYPGKNRGVGSA